MKQTSSLVGLQVSVLKFLGGWGVKKPGVWQSVNTVLVNVCLFFSATVLMFVAAFKEKEWAKVAISPLYSCNASLTLFKVVTYYSKSRNIERFLSNLDKIPFFAEEYEMDSKRSRVRRVVLLPKILGCLFTAVVGLMLIEPLVMGRLLEERAIPAWYPFEWQGKVGVCILLYVYEFLTAGCILMLAIAMDTFFAGVLLIIGGQFQSLGHRLQNLPEKNTQLWREQFVKCVLDYNRICQVCYEFESIFSAMIFTQASFSCLLICVSAYALRLATEIGIFIRFFAFILSMAYEVFIVCYAGDDIVEQSDRLFFQLYSSSWPSIPQDCKKMVLIFGLKLKYPVCIKFGFIQTLRLTTFTAIVDIAYKLYALMQQVPQ